MKVITNFKEVKKMFDVLRVQKYLIEDNMVEAIQIREENWSEVISWAQKCGYNHAQRFLGEGYPEDMRDTVIFDKSDEINKEVFLKLGNYLVKGSDNVLYGMEASKFKKVAKFIER